MITFDPAKDNQLQIDIDRPGARIKRRLLRLVEEHVKIESVRYSRSKSGNTHCRITLREPLSDTERILLQLALGSDPVRELLSWGRVRNGCPYPTLFFEKANENLMRG